MKVPARMPRRPGKGHTPVPSVTFPCPLCREVGRVVTLEAELEPDPPMAIVTDLHGGCAHAAAFRRGAANGRGGMGADRGRAARRERLRRSSN
jgi:hypothetical protein